MPLIKVTPYLHMVAENEEKVDGESPKSLESKVSLHFFHTLQRVRLSPELDMGLMPDQ